MLRYLFETNPDDREDFQNKEIWFEQDGSSAHSATQSIEVVPGDIPRTLDLAAWYWPLRVLKISVQVKVNLEKKADYCRQLLVCCVSIWEYVNYPQASIKFSAGFLLDTALRPISTVIVESLVESLLEVLFESKS